MRIQKKLITQKIIMLKYVISTRIFAYFQADLSKRLNMEGRINRKPDGQKSDWTVEYIKKKQKP